MHVLKRTISPYTDHDQCLGVFSSTSDAEQARDEYIAYINSGEHLDPWAEQAYHVVSLESDVCVMSDIPMRDFSSDAELAYVVSSFVEGFGQVIRKFECICGTKHSASSLIAEIQSRESEWPSYGEFEVFPIGVLRRPTPDI